MRGGGDLVSWRVCVYKYGQADRSEPDDITRTRTSGAALSAGDTRQHRDRSFSSRLLRESDRFLARHAQFATMQQGGGGDLDKNHYAKSRSAAVQQCVRACLRAHMCGKLKVLWAKLWICGARSVKPGHRNYPIKGEQKNDHDYG